jgi:tetratricopeptide (TPR) repeat protein
MRPETFATLVLSVALAAASPASAGRTPSSGPGDLLEIAKAFVGDRNCAVARPMLVDITAGADFKTLDSADRSLAWQMLGYCQNGQEAWTSFKQATDEADVTPYAWRMRFFYAVEYKDADDALISLEGAAANASAGVDVRDDSLRKLVARLVASGDETRLTKVFALLDAHGWTPKDPAGHADSLWTDYALLLVGKGDLVNARRVGARIVHPRDVLRVRLDKRFAPLLEGDGAKAFDVVKAAEADLAAKRKQFAAMPDDPDRLVSLAFGLKQVGRPAEGLALVDAWLAAHPVAEDARPPRWVLGARVDLLWALGRYDEAVAAERLAAAPGPDHANGIHIISLAGALNGLGQNREALSLMKALVIDRANGLDGYQTMLARAQEVCAAAAIGPEAKDDLDDALAYTAAHAADSDPARAEALLCAGDLDGAAALYIARLKDPARRLDALLAFSPMQRAPEPPADTALRARQARVAARPDVKAAIAAVGQTEPIPLAGGIASF